MFTSTIGAMNMPDLFSAITYLVWQTNDVDTQDGFRNIQDGGQGVTFSTLEPEGKLIMGCRKASIISSFDQGDEASLFGNNASVVVDSSIKNRRLHQYWKAYYSSSRSFRVSCILETPPFKYIQGGVHIVKAEHVEEIVGLEGLFL